jgi:Fe-S-cluster containining protein
MESKSDKSKLVQKGSAFFENELEEEDEKFYFNETFVKKCKIYSHASYLYNTYPHIFSLRVSEVRRCC